jgi:plastocyanin domain-containing protein
MIAMTADDAQSPITTAPAPKASPATVAPATPKATVTPSTKAQAKPKAPAAKKASSKAQHFDIQIGAAGYEPSVVTAASGRPVTLTVGKGQGCAAGFLMPSLGIDKDNSSGPVTVKLGVLEPGTYGFSCGMGMVQGRLVVR